MRNVEILKGIEQNQLDNIDNMNGQIKHHMEYQFQSVINFEIQINYSKIVYSKLNYTRVIYEGNIAQLNTFFLDQDCNMQRKGSSAIDKTNECVLQFTQDNLDYFKQNPSKNFLFFYKYNIHKYDDLSQAEKDSIMKIIQFIDFQRQVFKSLNDMSNNLDQYQLNFFHIPSSHMFVFDSAYLNNKESSDFANLLANYQNCQRYTECLKNQNESECKIYKDDCEKYTACNELKNVNDKGCDLECIQEDRDSTYSFNIFKTKLQILNNFTHVCLTIIDDNLEYCSRVDYYQQFKNIISFDKNRFNFIFTDQNFTQIYNNFEDVNFFHNQTIENKIVSQGQANADDNFSPSLIQDSLSFIFKNNNKINKDVEPNQIIINIDSSQSYDSIKILLSMDILRLPLTYIETIQTPPQTLNFGVFLFTSNDKFDEQKSFFDIFSYLFFIYTSMEIVFIMAFFFVLSFLVKRLLITVAQSIIFFSRFVQKIDQNFEISSDEIHNFMKFSKQKMLASEIQVLAENLDHFVWVVDFFSKAKEAKHENQMLKKGIVIFKKINSYEGLEIVFDKLISQYKRNTAETNNIEEAMNYCREILQIQLDRRSEILEKKDRQSVVEEDLQKITNKICQYINNILNLIAKLLTQTKAKLDKSKDNFQNRPEEEKKMEEYNEIYQAVIKISKELNFKDFLKVRLLIKNARILYKRATINNTALFKSCAKKLENAWKLLEEIKQSDKDDNFQIKNITVLKQKVLFHKGVACQHYGNDSEALKFLVSSLEYGNYYSNRLRVKTLNFMAIILRNPIYRKKKEILKDLSAFIRKDKRNFYILVDCSRQIQDNKNKVATIIFKIFNEYMSDKDKIMIIRYGDKVENVIDLNEKEVHKKYQDFSIESIEKQLHQSQSSGRCLYKAFQQCLKEAKAQEEKAISKYIIMFAFGENNSKKELRTGKDDYKHGMAISNSMNSNLDEDDYSSGNPDENSQVSMSVISMKDKINRPEGDEDFDNIQKELTEGFFHLLLIKSNIKNHGSQKSKILQLCEKSRRHYIIDLENKPFITDIIKDVAGFLS